MNNFHTYLLITNIIVLLRVVVVCLSLGCLQLQHIPSQIVPFSTKNPSSQLLQTSCSLWTVALGAVLNVFPAACEVKVQFIVLTFHIFLYINHFNMCIFMMNQPKRITYLNIKYKIYFNAHPVRYEDDFTIIAFFKHCKEECTENTLFGNMYLFENT